MLVATETLTPLFETDYYSIAHDATLQAVIITYKRKGTSDEFRELHFKLVEAFDRVVTSKVLVEAHSLGIVAPDDQRWLGQYIIPLLAQKTLQQFLFVAVVVPEDVFTELAVNTVEKISVETGMCQNMSFRSTAAARLWLSEQQ